MICEKCGHNDIGKFCGYCGFKFQTPTKDPGNFLTWPLQQKGWPGNLWILLLWPAPFFGQIISSGWSVNAIGRRGRHDECAVPSPSDFVAIFRQGMITLLMFVVYFVIPIFIIGLITDSSWLSLTWNLIVTLWNLYRHETTQSLPSVLIGYAIQIFQHAVTPIVYILIATPMFLAARVRYGLTDSALSFFNLYRNAIFCFTHIGEMLLYFFFSWLFRIAVIFLLTLLLAIPVVGLFAPLVIGAVGIWVRAWWAGGLAQQMFTTESGKTISARYVTSK
jgi:hypothetical protein